MKARIEIPKGWRRVTRGVVKKGDRWFCCDNCHDPSWELQDSTGIGTRVENCYFLVIRRVAAKGAKAKDDQDKRPGLVRVGKGTVRPNG